DRAGRPAHLLGGPNDVYRRVAAPAGPHTPSPVTHSDRAEGFAAGGFRHSAPCRPSPVSGPPFSLFRAAPDPPSPARSRPPGPLAGRSRPGMRAPTSPRRRGGAHGRSEEHTSG